MTKNDLKTLCTKLMVAGHTSDQEKIYLARVANALLDQLEWHDKRSAQLRAIGHNENIVAFAEVHEVAADRINTTLNSVFRSSSCTADGAYDA